MPRQPRWDFWHAVTWGRAWRMAPDSRHPRTFPPVGCRLCELQAVVVGMALSKEQRLMHRVYQAECRCGIILGAHGIEHPHPAPLMGCQGVEAAQGPRAGVLYHRKGA